MAAIILAHAPPFRIGPLEVFPATRTVKRDDVETVLEPRVMQVLVALATAEGTVVSRDQLIEACWEGRIVGDDAINRVLSRLRAVARGVAAGTFRVETITRVGYRLVRADADAAELRAPSFALPGVDRRAVLALGGGSAVLASLGFWLGLRQRDRLAPAARAEMERGRDAIRQATPDQTAAAIAAFREAAMLAPGDAEPWGQLALAYRQQLAQSGAKNDADAVRLEGRARAAAERALSIDRDNADARVALGALRPPFGQWLRGEESCRRALERYPDHVVLNQLYGFLLGEVGRVRESIVYLRRALAADPLWPQVQARLAASLWFAGQLDQSDTEMARAFAAWPRHFSVWFTRVRLLTYTGRAPDALAMLGDEANRPVGVPEWNYAVAIAETRAIATRSAADVDAASARMKDVARHATGLAINAIVFHAAIGRLDDAFALIDAYYFDRGFTIGPNRYSPEQGQYGMRRQRAAYFLYQPETAPLRADPRFAALVRTIGLEDYWKRSNTRPDFRA